MIERFGSLFAVERIALIFELIGVFLLSIEAIKIENLRNLAALGLAMPKTFLKKTEWMDQFLQVWRVIYITLGVAFVLLLQWLVDFLDYITYAVLALLAPLALLICLALLFHIVALLMRAVSLALDYTPTGTTGIIGFMMLSFSIGLRFYHG